MLKTRKGIVQEGAALKHAPAELRSDKEVVVATVRKRGAALQHASPELRGDKTAEELKMDCDFGLEAGASHQH
eukprot:5049125-Heterocapsa_arctica.AAC.1